MRLAVRLLCSTAALAAGVAPVAAQVASSARATGMAGAYGAIATGAEAVQWNPANLGFADRPAWSLSLPRLNAEGTLLGPSVFDTRDIFRKGSGLTDQDRQAFLDEIPDAGVELGGGASVPWVSLSVGPFAAEVSTTGLAGGSLGKELFDLLLYTRQYGDVDYSRLADYRVGNTAVRDAAYSTIAVSYGKELSSLLPLPFPVSVGVTARYVKGHELQRARIYEPDVDLAAQTLSITALSIRSKGGSGYGVDLGVSARPLPALTVGLTVQNLVQHMQWDSDLELRGDRFSSNELGALSVQDIYDRMEPRPFDPNAVPPEAFELASELYQQTYFPRIIRASAALRVGSTTLGSTFRTTAGKGELATGWPKYLAFGVEQNVPFLSFLTLRGGVASSLDGASALSGGTTLQFGPVGLSAAITKLNGNAKSSESGVFDSTRFPERLEAGNGVGFSLGLDLSWY